MFFFMTIFTALHCAVWCSSMLHFLTLLFSTHNNGSRSKIIYSRFLPFVMIYNVCLYITSINDSSLLQSDINSAKLVYRQPYEAQCR
jgi:hypothetical protein